jgi:ankyrin repeat protein
LTTLEGESPLEMAVRLNNPWIVGKLMDMNVNFKRKNSQRETVLHIALKNQTHKNILKRLTAKIDINEPIDEFGSYLNLAIISGHTDNFFFLIKELSLNYTKSFDSEGNTCLILAVQYNRGDFLVSILDKLA